MTINRGSAAGFGMLLLVPTLLGAQTLEDRITDILSRMSTAEKILQLHQEGGFNTADNARLGIPGFVMADGPHGVRDGLATSFPVGIGMASTWDVELAYRVGLALGKEFRGKGKHQALGPCLDIDRDPRNGRSPETGGEDPYLCAQITTAVVKGIQTTPTVATIKHYNFNHREYGRTSNNVVASPRALREQGGLAFRTAVQQGGALSVMNAYNRINGEWCAESPNLLTNVLRTEWGFPYYVVSDWGSIVHSDLAIKAGCDICMGSDKYRDDLPFLVTSGTVPEEVINNAVRRVLRTKLIAGMLDYQPAGNPNDVNSAAHRQLCLEAGRKSLVLLKNEGNILPLGKSPSGYIALIGPSADVAQIDGSGSAYVTPVIRISPRQGMEALIGSGKVQYAKGCDINSQDTSGFAGALAIARGADAVVFCGGLDPNQEGEGFDRVGGSIDLPGKQQDLILALSAANPNLVAVIYSGGICGLHRSIQAMKGLIYAFYPGQEGGTALAEVLFGDQNPGGKLPVTMPVSDAQLPAWNDDMNDDYGCGYRWFDSMNRTPEFPFGYGLSYTTFAYSGLQISPSVTEPGVPVTVSVDVTNTGLRVGEEVVQLYLTDIASSVPVAVKELKGFRRVMLAPGETRQISFALTADELYTYNESAGRYDIEAGTFAVRVGGSSAFLPLSGTFQVTDGPRKPDLVITGIKMVPPYPLPGQKVLFLASVKNQGSAPTPAGLRVKVAFQLNGSQVSWSDEAVPSIPPGGMALICGNRGVGETNTWSAGPIGSYSVGAAVDPENALDECVEGNNGALAELQVYAAPKPNLALRKSVAVTSVERSGLEGDKAVDGSLGTRWSSMFSDPQAIVVDLGALYSIEDVVLYWEGAYAKEYYLRISDGVGPWVDVFHVTDGTGGMVRIPVGANGRKVMVAGVQRGTSYGYSLYEIEVHGGAATAVEEPAAEESLPGEFVLSGGFPNPFNPSTRIRYGVPVRSQVTISVYNDLGQHVATLVEGEKDAGYYDAIFDASGLSSGVYLCRFQAVGFVQTRRLILLR